ESIRHPYLANVLNDLGAAEYALGRLADAQTHMGDAVEIWRNTEGITDRSFTVDTIQNLATICSLIGASDKAEQLYNETLEILREAQINDDFRRAQVIRGLGELYLDSDGLTKGLDEAERHLKSALDLAQGQVGPKSARMLP